MSDDVVRLSVIGQILRRRWRLLLALAALGAVVGATASLLWPPAYESSSRVLLQGSRDKAEVSSEALIAMSLVVLNRAADGLNWGIDGAQLRDSVTAKVIDGNVIEIMVKADSPDKARQFAELVTQQYIVFSTEILINYASVSGEVLAPRKAGLQQQIEGMNQRIRELLENLRLLNAATPQGAAARAELQQLSSNRTDALKVLNDLDGRLVDAQAQVAASRENFSVIEPPVASPSPVTPTRLQLVVVGAVLAAVLGAVVLIAVRQADRRLRRSADIAAALGAPVLGAVQALAAAAVTSPTPGSSNGHDAGDRRSWLQRLLGYGDRWDVPRIRTSGDQSLERVRYRRVLDRLRGAPDKAVRLLVVIADDDVLASRAVGPLATEAGAAAVLSMVSVSAARPTIPDSHGVSGALVVLASGTRTAWELLAIAKACHDAGNPVAGALVVLPGADEDQAGDPDPDQLWRNAAVGLPGGRLGGGQA